MSPTWRRRLFLPLFLLAGIAAAVWALWPQPVPVDTTTVLRGALEVTVSEESRTRVRHVFTVSAPLSGTVQRSPREVGDPVTAGETIVAVIRPAAPALLDIRTRREAEAAIAVAEAAIELAEVQMQEAEAQLAYAETDYARSQRLAERGAITERELDQARILLAFTQAQRQTATATIQMRRRELETARARLVELEEGIELPSEEQPMRGIRLRSPIDGQVLALHLESEQVVAAGTPLIDLGDPADLEVVAELLSSDAVRVTPGAPATIDGWGGGQPLAATVRQIEPAGFTKVSALGIEEQRVRVILDLEASPPERQRLGHGYRAVAHITVERIEDAILVPLAALFRRGPDWSVFLVDAEGRAVEQVVEIGQRTSRQAVVLSGLQPGERVILHPSDRVAHGVGVEERPGG